MTTGSDYDNFEFHEALVKCLNDTDPLLYESVNSQWARFRAFAETGGDRSDRNDPWYSCDEDKFAPEVRKTLHENIQLCYIVASVVCDIFISPFPGSLV